MMELGLRDDMMNNAKCVKKTSIPTPSTAESLISFSKLKSRPFFSFPETHGSCKHNRRSNEDENIDRRRRKDEDLEFDE